MPVKIIPKGEYKQTLIKNIGQDHWIYNGVPSRMLASANGMEIQVYTFKYDLIPFDVCKFMAESRALVTGKSILATHSEMKSIPIAIPCDHIDVVEVQL